METRKILTTSSRGLLEDSFPYRLFQKAKKFGVWNPSDFDFSQDVKDWKSFTEEQRESIVRLIAQFQGGEEAVTRDLLPLMMVIANEGRLEEEMFLTTFLFEEAKHTEFFRLLLNELGETRDLSCYHSETYNTIFNEILPTAMERLVDDHSPEALAEASTVYNMFVEGVLAETGYYGFYQSLEKIGAMPALLKGVDNLKRDESRHIAYGTYLLQRLISEHPHIYDIVKNKMEELTPLAFKLNQEGNTGINPFGTDVKDTMNFTMRQLSVRMEILARSKGKKIEDIFKQKEIDFEIV